MPSLYSYEDKDIYQKAQSCRKRAEEGMTMPKKPTCIHCGLTAEQSRGQTSRHVCEYPPYVKHPQRGKATKEAIDTIPEYECEAAASNDAPKFLLENIARRCTNGSEEPLIAVKLDGQTQDEGEKPSPYIKIKETECFPASARVKGKPATSKCGNAYRGCECPSCTKQINSVNSEDAPAPATNEEHTLLRKLSDVIDVYATGQMDWKDVRNSQAIILRKYVQKEVERVFLLRKKTSEKKDSEYWYNAGWDDARQNVDIEEQQAVEKALKDDDLINEQIDQAILNERVRTRRLNDSIFISHIEKHLKNMDIKTYGGRAICKICNKTVDEIYAEEKQEFEHETQQAVEKAVKAYEEANCMCDCGQIGYPICGACQPKKEQQAVEKATKCCLCHKEESYIGNGCLASAITNSNNQAVEKAMGELKDSLNEKMIAASSRTGNIIGLGEAKEIINARYPNMSKSDEKGDEK